MAKKIRFPLEMKDGVEVRDIEELKENFSLEQVLFYLSDGKLITWLRDRYLDDIADAVLALNQEDADFHKKICDIFEVEYVEEREEDIEKVMERKRKKTLLKEFTDEEKFYDAVDQIAFEQDDLYDLLDEGKTTIYLCGEKFSIPLGKKGIHYIGINCPVVTISSKEKVDFEEKDILLENTQFDEKYQSVLEALGYKGNGQPINDSSYSAEYGDYSSGSYLNFLLSSADRKGAEECYNKIRVLLGSLKYDVDDDIRELREKLRDSGLAGMAESYLNSL